MQEMNKLVQHEAVRAVALPPGAGIAPLYAGSNLADAYAVALPTAQARQMDAGLARIVLGSQPGWARKLMVLRDAIVARFGIRRRNSWKPSQASASASSAFIASATTRSSWARMTATSIFACRCCATGTWDGMAA
jgi:hypothetical protein